MRKETESSIKERVYFANEQVVYGEHFDSGSIIWGGLLIIGGTILFLNTIDIISWGVWRHLWYFWPVLLILNGMQIILGNHRFSSIFMTCMTLLFFFFVALYAIIQVSPELLQYIPRGLANIVRFMGGLRS